MGDGICFISKYELNTLWYSMQFVYIYFKNFYHPSTHPSEHSKNHATSHVNLNAKSAVRIYMLCRLTMGFITSDCKVA